MNEQLWAIFESTDFRVSGAAHLWTGEGRFTGWRSRCGLERFYTELRSSYSGFPKCARCARKPLTKYNSQEKP